MSGLESAILRCLWVAAIFGLRGMPNSDPRKYQILRDEFSVYVEIGSPGLPITAPWYDAHDFNQTK